MRDESLLKLFFADAGGAGADAGRARGEARATTTRSPSGCARSRPPKAAEASASRSRVAALRDRLQRVHRRAGASASARASAARRAPDVRPPRPTRRPPRRARRRSPRVVFFVVAGALGAGVADRLDPYGADDPDTESVIADERLEDAGYRTTEVVVLIEGVDPTLGRRRASGSRSSTSEVARRRRASQAVTGFADDRARARSSRATATRPTSRSASSRPTTTSARTPPSGSPPRSRTSPGSASAARPSPSAQVNEQVESDLRTRRAARLPAPLPALAALLPQPGRRAAAAAGRRPGDRRHLPDAARRERARLDLDLRPQPGHRPRASGWRSTTACSSSRATARRSRKHRPGARGDAADDGDRRAHGPVQLADRRRRARLAAASSRSASSTRWGSAARWSR